MSGKTHAGTTMSIHAHIKELRTRLFVIVLIFIVGSMIAYMYRDPLIALLLGPLQGQKLSYLTPGGGFSFIFKVVMWGGIALSLPFAIYMLYGFISPILPQRAQRKSAMILISSFILVCCGATFGYIYAIPGAMKFLLTFADNYVNAMLTADSYLNFVLVYTVGLGALFQIPLLMIITNWIVPLKPKKLLSMERYVVVVAFILAALITPTPDAINQTIIAAPIIAMYQIGFLAVVFSGRKQRKLLKQLKRANKKRLKLVAKRPGVIRVGKYAMRNYYLQPLIAKRKLVVPGTNMAQMHAVPKSAPTVARIKVKPVQTLSAPIRRPASLHVVRRTSSQRLQQPSRVLLQGNRVVTKRVDGFGQYRTQNFSL